MTDNSTLVVLRIVVDNEGMPHEYEENEFVCELDFKNWLIDEGYRRYNSVVIDEKGMNYHEVFTRNRTDEGFVDLVIWKRNEKQVIEVE